jgi:electron transfer flavoprotein beta subunit
VVGREQPKLVIMGKQAIDNDCNQVGQMLAALLNWPQATFASDLLVQDHRTEVTREIDGGLETIAIELPAVVTTDLRLNEPRYTSLPNIMKAKSKPLEKLSIEELGVNLKPHCETLKVERPSERMAGVKVSDINELLDKLKNQEKVL